MAFSLNERREIEDLIRRMMGLAGPGAPPTGPAGGDLSGTYPNPSVVDDSHAHTNATVTGPFPPNGAAGGDLSGTYPNPSVVDDSHAHTAATLPATMPPSAHAASHQNGGGDEVNVAGLSGRLADAQDTDNAPGTFALTANITASFAGGVDQDNWNPAGLSTATRVDVTVTGGAFDGAIAGIVGGADGRVLTVGCDEASTTNLYLIHEALTSIASTRISIPSAPVSTYYLYPGEAVSLQYNSTLSRWVLLTGGTPQSHAALHADGAIDELTAASITDAMLKDMPARSVKGNPSAISGAPQSISAGTDGHVLHRSGTTIGFGTLGFDSLDDVASQRLVGRGDASTGDLAAISLDTGISITTGEVLLVDGRRASVTVLTSGSGTYNVPTGVTSLEVYAVGGGGGGGGAAHAAGSSAAGGGGAGGAFCYKRFTSLAASYSYAVGAGGAGGAAGANNGTAGGNTTFSTMTAPGGGFGTGSAASAVAALVAAGSSSLATGGDANGSGLSGLYGLILAGAGPAAGGQGGSSWIGGGGVGRITQANGSNGIGPGAGGAGGVTTNGGGPGTTKTGGNGQDGIIIIFELY